MIGKIQQHIFFQNNIGNTIYILQQRMYEWFFSRIFYLKNCIRKIHEIFEIMNSSAGLYIVFYRKPKPLNEIGKERRINIFIENKSYRLTFFTILYTLFMFLDERSGYIIIYLNFSISCNFNYVGRKSIMTEVRKYLRKTKPDYIFKQNNVLRSEERRVGKE